MSSPRLFSTLIVIGCGLSPLLAQADKADLDAHVQKARDALARQDLAAADEQYAEILELQPGNIDVNAARGMTLYALGKPAEATAPLRAALAADPGRSDAESFLALSLADIGQCRDAL